MTKLYKITIEVEMRVRDGTTREQAENALIDLIDHGMLYSIGKNEVKDGGYPYIFDWDIIEQESE